MASHLDLTQLLERHKPVLLMFPSAQARNSPRHKDPPWGDYTPCSAKFFLSFARLGRKKPSLIWGVWNMILDRLGLWKPPAPDGMEKIRSHVAQVERRDTDKWELDQAPIKTWHSTHAWTAYRKMLGDSSDCVTYGRSFQQGADIALQYWFLFIYNDSYNKHEGDWELVSIELDPDGTPLRLRMSCHQGTFLHDWNDPLLAKDASGNRPLIRFARGSHGAYADYGNGTRAIAEALRNWVRPKSFVKRTLYGAAASAFRLFAIIWGWRDTIPADRLIDGDQLADNVYGERIEPQLVRLPDDSEFDRLRDDPEWWWVRYNGKWGSVATVIMGFVGTCSPWVMPDSRWTNPAAWVRGDRW
jgi:hypothetical protein